MAESNSIIQSMENLRCKALIDADIASLDQWFSDLELMPFQRDCGQ